ncbi:MAG TPA: FmdB family zinc ribbon protein [Nocardioides sp.]|nr:FmdB family zinc ribbon protein [Nocardioides sp.]
MPTYQYACTECGHAFDQFQSFSDDALTQCPECQGRLRKIFNAVGVVFKGSGFYRNDSRDKKPSALSSESKSDGKSDTTSDSGASSDTKSETKSDKQTATSSSSSAKAPATA